jgi:predicted transcriptional regulator
MAELRQFNVYLTPELIREVKHHAVETEQSLSAIVAAAVREYLAKQQKGRKKS